MAMYFRYDAAYLLIRLVKIKHRFQEIWIIEYFYIQLILYRFRWGCNEEDTVKLLAQTKIESIGDVISMQ